MRLNNKGFAITVALYGTMILFLLISASSLGMLSTYKLRSEKLIEEEGGAREIITGTSTCISSGSLYRTIANNADINTNIEFVNDNGSVTDRTNGLFRLQSTASEACPVYYYRGIVDNNYVSFANKCWKIVRTTSTGGVKIIYYGDLGTGGKCKSNSTGSIQEAPFNTQTSSNHSGAEAGYMYGKWYATRAETEGDTFNLLYYGPDVEYDGENYKLVSKNGYSPQKMVARSISNNKTNIANHHYTCWKENATSCNKVYYVFNVSNSSTQWAMYYIELSGGEKIEDAVRNMFTNSSNETDSFVKTKLDAWYRNNMTSYTNMLEDTPFCNDRSILSLNGFNPNGGMGALIFSSYKDSNNPILTCPNKNDAFTVNDTVNGNGKLTYPIGLLTSAEYLMGRNQSSVGALNLYRGLNMTPSDVGFNNGYVSFNAICGVCGSNHNVTGDYYHVSPVLSLKGGINIISGDGTLNSPYNVGF